MTSWVIMTAVRAAGWDLVLAGAVRDVESARGVCGSRWTPCTTDLHTGGSSSRTRTHILLLSFSLSLSLSGMIVQFVQYHRLSGRLGPLKRTTRMMMTMMHGVLSSMKSWGSVQSHIYSRKFVGRRGTRKILSRPVYPITCHPHTMPRHPPPRDGSPA